MTEINPEVSIFCVMHDHKKYVKQCLYLLLQQKTDISFEILVYNDASTDRASDAIREFTEKYPQIVRRVEAPKDRHPEQQDVIRDILLPQARGRYIAFCGESDAWIDSQKLQKQTEILRHQKGYDLCLCRTRLMDRGGKFLEMIQPQRKFPVGGMASRYFLKRYILNDSFPLCSVMISTALLREYCESYPEFARQFHRCHMVHIPLLLYAALHSDVYYLPEILCARHCEKTEFEELSGAGNLTKSQVSRQIRGLRKAYKLYDRYTNGGYHRMCDDRRGWFADQQKQYFFQK